MDDENRSIAVVLTLSTFTMAALAQSGPRSPGVVVRVYEFEGDVSSIPGLAPNQAPSDVFMAETLDLNEKTRKIPDRSVLLVDGFVKAAAAGEYGFRLISDDGSMLWIDGALVVDHDGLHGATPKEGSIKLAAGEHARCKFATSRDGRRDVAAEWKPPGSGDFVLAPKEALSSEGAKDKASPGKKKIVAPLRRGLPGDGAPVNGPHPGFKSGGPFNSGEMTFDKLSSKVRTGISGNHEPSSFAIWMPNLGSAAHYSTTLARRRAVHRTGRLRRGAGRRGSMRVFLDSFPAQSKTFKTYEQSAAFRFGPSDGNSVAPAGKLVFEMLGVASDGQRT
jgi:hypothetical protein